MRWELQKLEICFYATWAQVQLQAPLLKKIMERSEFFCHSTCSHRIGKGAAIKPVDRNCSQLCKWTTAYYTSYTTKISNKKSFTLLQNKLLAKIYTMCVNLFYARGMSIFFFNFSCSPLLLLEASRMKRERTRSRVLPFTPKRIKMFGIRIQD